MRILARLSALLDAFSEWTGRAVSWLLLLMVAVGAYNALARYLGRYVGVELSSNGLLEAQWYLFSIVFLLGATVTLRRDEHVRVDVMYAKLSVRGKAWVDLLGGVLLLLPFCVFAIVYSLPGALESLQLGEQSPDPGGLPRYPLKLLVPLTFTLLAGQGVSEVIKRVLILTNNTPPADPSAQPPSNETPATGDQA